jgi:hypothetical protein
MSRSPKTPAVPPAPTFSPELLQKLAKVDPYALELLADFEGPQCFNPIVGRTPTETFLQMNSALGFVHGLLNSQEGPAPEWHDGLALFIESIWTAAQYEAFRVDAAGKEGGL